MKAPELAPDEERRLSLLEQLGIVYSPAEERFDRITRLTKRIFKVPIALVSLVTANTQWFKSSQGLLAAETSREVSFCGHAILGDETFIIADTHKDPDFADNPLVVDEPHIRFYAGHPLRINGVKIGTLCVIDRRPRRFDAADIDTIQSLAMWVENEVKLSLYTASQKELMTKFSTLQRKSLVDPVTGCWNQKGSDKLLYSEMERANRDRRPVSILILRIQNDSPGSQPVRGSARDQLFKDIAQGIRGAVRTHDVVGRLDTDRFLVFLGNCRREDGRVLMQRIMRTVALARIKVDDRTIRSSAKVGITCNENTDIWSATRLLDTAEEALSIAKDKKAPNAWHFLAPRIEG